MQRQNRILIVDDQPTNVDILCKILRKDYELETGANGEECLEKVRTFEPDLVLLDIMMPGIDGYEACRRIKTSPVGQFTPVILVSGKASAAERLQGYEAQADDYVVKPYNHEELLSKVRIQFRLREAQLKLWSANEQIQLYNAELERLVEERTAQIVATQDVAVFALAQLAESRDSDTGEHLVRIRTYAQILADRLGENGVYADQIDEQFLADLYRSSPLHDVGKVGIADSVLLKPDRLTPSEFELMKQHVVIGAETLERAARHSGGGHFLTMAAEIARCHHEWFDGSGHCAGLKGEEIPLAARIVAVVDAYDALTSVRVYKPAYSAEVSRQIIEDECDRHFDPVIVEAFLEVYQDFLPAEESDGPAEPALAFSALAAETD